MTLQKERDPLSVHGAIARIIDELGAKRAALAVGVSQTMVYIWSDPNDHRLPNIDQAVRLDAHWCANANGRSGSGEPVILPAMMRLLQELTGTYEPTPEASVQQVMRETMDVTAALGRLSQVVAQATQDGTLTEEERRSISEAAKRVERELGHVQQKTRPRRKN